MTSDDVNQILQHVGRDFVPETLNHSELQKDILIVWDFYKGYQRTTAKGPRTRQRKYAEKVSNKADDLFKLLDDPGPHATLVRRAIDQNLSEAGAEPFLVPIKHGSNKLAMAARAAVRKYSDRDLLHEILEVSPTEWLLGDGLVWVYEKHFGRPATRTREDGGSLEFIRFATAVAAQLGEPYTDETVSKAISVLRKRPTSRG